MRLLGVSPFWALQLLPVFTVLASLCFIVAQAADPPITSLAPSVAQSSWAKFEKIFVFGDSWSNINFNWSSTQPGASNPLSNPHYNASNVEANGARWPVYLTITYNASRLQTYVLAQTGGVLDNNITFHVNDFVSQISNGFLSVYGDANSGNWSAKTTLFISFFAVNDVNLVLPMKNASAYLDRMFVSYGQSIEKLYKAGGRNFLILNESTMDLAPKALPGMKPLMADFNARLTAMIASLAKKYHSTKNPSTSLNIVLYSTHTLFTTIIKDPTINPITACIKNVTGWCPAYYDKGRRHGADFYDRSCGNLVVGEYIWSNAIYPSLTMYRAMADGIAGLFGG